MHPPLNHLPKTAAVRGAHLAPPARFSTAILPPYKIDDLFSCVGGFTLVCQECQTDSTYVSHPDTPDYTAIHQAIISDNVSNGGKRQNRDSERRAWFFRAGVHAPGKYETVESDGLATAPARSSCRFAARGATPAAFDERCIPAACVAPRSNTDGILARRALSVGRIARLGATRDLHHGPLRTGTGASPEGSASPGRPSRRRTRRSGASGRSDPASRRTGTASSGRSGRSGSRTGSSCSAR